MENGARTDERSVRTNEPMSAEDNSITSNQHSDRLGVVCAVGCAIQCGALPLINATMPSLGRFSEVAHSEPLRWGLTAVTGIGAYALARAGFVERKYWYAGVAMGGMAAIVAGNVVHADEHNHNVEYDDPLARRLIAQRLRDPENRSREVQSLSSSDEGQPSVAVDGNSNTKDRHCHPESHGWAGEVLCLVGGISLGLAHLWRMIGRRGHAH